MPGEGPKLCGVEPITGTLIEQLVQRPQGRSRPKPVVVAVGPHGTGKTALLQALAQRCGRLPHAYLDFGASERTPREVFGELAFELGKHRRQFGRVAFPQLWLCLLAVGSTLHMQDDNRREALRSLRRIVSSRQAVERNRDGILDFLQAAGEVPEGLPAWVAPASDALLRSLGWLDRRRRLTLGPRLAGGGVNREDMLIDLARWAFGDDQSRAEADAIFGAAFLHDLRQAYTGFNRSRRTLNCVVLLDNVHTAAGRQFLRTLAEARRRNGPDPDPLVVVATSAEWLPVWSDCWHRPGVDRLSEDTEPRTPEHRTGNLRLPAPRNPVDIAGDWPETDYAGEAWDPWYLLDLSRLSAQAIGDIAAEQRLRSIPRVVDFVQALTGGNACGAADIIAALARTDDPDPLAGARTVLTAPAEPRPWTEPEPTTEPDTILDRARAYLLQDFTDPTDQRDLATAAAGRTVEMLYQPEILDSVVADGEELLQDLRNRLWIRGTTDREPAMVLDPWLRQILLRELAARGDTDARNWERTHTLCRELYARRFADGDGPAEVEALYHDLALGRLVGAVDYLGRPLATGSPEFDRSTAAAWLADLDLITSAPRRPDTRGTPIAQVEAVVRANGMVPEHGLAWLVAALWISTDPLGDPQRTLDRTIENEFRQLARGLGRGALLLYERAERYR